MDSSGVTPTEYNILVLPEETNKKTDGGLYLPEDVTAKDGFAQTRGTLIAAGPMAFEYEDWPKDREDEKPEVGDKIYFARYAGGSSKIKGKDGVEYWLIKDRDILATIEE